MNERVVLVEDANKQLKIELDLTSDNFQSQTERTHKQSVELQTLNERNFSLERCVAGITADR